MTSGEPDAVVTTRAEGESKKDMSKRVAWRFELAEGKKVSRSVYLLDIAAAVAFDCRIAVKEV